MFQNLLSTATDVKHFLLSELCNSIKHQKEKSLLI
jgi:hypothetical protein